MQMGINLSLISRLHRRPGEAHLLQVPPAVLPVPRAVRPEGGFGAPGAGRGLRVPGAAGAQGNRQGAAQSVRPHCHTRWGRNRKKKPKNRFCVMCVGGGGYFSNSATFFQVGTQKRNKVCLNNKNLCPTYMTSRLCHKLHTQKSLPIV